MNTTYNKKVTIGDLIEQLLEGKNDYCAFLKEIYKHVQEQLPHVAEETIRCAIYRDSKKRFKRMAKGLYMLVGEKTSSLLIQGDSRSLEDIDDESIDCIINDHPWEDKKAHRSGNQKEFGLYEKFKYKQEDFDNKARVLKDGCFLAEFIPMESESNYEYLYEIKQMAKKAGLNYYAKIMWQKDKATNRCLGRTTKEFEEIMIFYKGKKPRKLSKPNVSGFRTREILPAINSFYESKDTIEELHDLCNSLIEIVEEEKDIVINELIGTKQVLPVINTYYAAKGKKKNHDSEKPIELYEFLIEMLTDEKEIVLDQFGGACNLLKGALNKNRFAIVYEICSDFIKKAVNRFGCKTIYDEEIQNEEYTESESINELEITIEIIPKETTEFQLKFLNTIKNKKIDMLNEEDLKYIELANKDVEPLASTINEMFDKIVKSGYSNYKVPTFNINLENYIHLNQIEAEIDSIFDKKFENKYLKSFYSNYKMEVKAFIEFCISIENIFDFNIIKTNLSELINKYINHIKQYFKDINYKRSFKLISEFLN